MRHLANSVAYRLANSAAYRLVALALVFGGASPLLAQSVLPQGGSVVGGSATIGTPANNALTITQNSQNAIINWNSFSIGRPNTVIFNQPNSSSAILNRVTGNTPSTIAGALRANGRVYLVNPNGIALTSSGTVDVGGGFVASTLGISNEDFMAGKQRFTGNGSSAAVSNAGKINVGRGGFVALLGGTVSNKGTINVPIGKVGLGSGESATLDLTGDGFLQIAVPTASKARNGRALINVSGRITANGGSIELKAATVKQAIRDAVNVSGSLSARSVSGHSGAIVLGGGVGGNIRVAGRLNTSARRTAKATNGGIIAITGNKVAIADNARIMAASKTAKGGAISVTGTEVTIGAATFIASGAAGGGSILIGGSWQGAGPLAHADAVVVAPGATLRADATHDGDGGTVVVWSDGATSVKGILTAVGAGLGNGGMIETSGHVLDVAGISANASAPSGTAGTWLLDPYNLTVGNSASTATQSPAGTWTSNAGGSVVLNTDINTVLNAGTNVVLQTSGALGDGFGNGDITINSAITKSAGGNANLTLLAAGSIIVNAAINSTTGALAVTLNSNRLGAGGYVNIQAPITTNGGALVIGGGANPLTGAAVGTAVQAVGVTIARALSAGGGAITINGSGFNSAGNNNFGINQTATITNNGAGSITLNGTGGGTGNNEMGVVSAANITAATGNISITGAASPTAIFIANHGVKLAGGITSTTGTGTITIDGTATGVTTGLQSYGVVVQGAAAVRAADGLISVTGHNTATGNGIGNNGVYVTGAGSKIVSTGTGGVTVLGFGGGTGTGGSNYGVFWDAANAIQSTGTGALTITGTGGDTGGSGIGNFGVNANAALTAIGGPITITGTGGSAGGSGGLNSGVNIGAALAGAGGAISITGIGGNSSGTGNSGITQVAAITNTGTGSITLNGIGGGNGIQESGILSNANITAGTGDISVTGAASATAIGSASHGVQFLGGTRSTTGVGTITIAGTARGSGTGANTRGVSIVSGAIITAVDGLISVTGTNNSTGTGTGNTGVNVTGANSTISSTGTGGVTVIGTGGGTGGSNYGVAWDVANGIQSTGTGAINIIGSGGGIGGSGGGNNGVNSTAALTGNGGAISITGTPSNSTGGGNFGISLASVTAGVATLTLSSTGAVTSSGALTAAQLNLLGTGGSHTLTNSGNAVTTLSANTGSVSYAQTGSLSIGTIGGTAGVTTTDGVSITTAGNLTIEAGAPVSGAGLTLAATGAFINNAGSGAVTATSGRWLIYSNNPAADTFGDLNSNNAAIWNTAPNAAVAATGNRYVFAIQPTLTFTTVDASKVYGTNATATVAESFAITGLQSVANAFSDTAAAVYSGAPSVTSTGSATTATVAGSPYVITAATGTVHPLTNYAFAFVSAGQLFVTAAPITITGDTQSAAFPSYFSPNDFIGNAGNDNGFALASFATATGEPTCTPVGILQALNRHQRVDLTGGNEAFCKPRFLPTLRQ